MRFRSAALAVALVAGGLSVAPLAHAAPPANDAVEDATPLTVGFEAPYSLIESTDTDETVCGEGAAVWFTFVAPAAGDYLLYTADGTADADAFIYTSLDDPTACTGEADEPVDSYEMYSVVPLGSGATLTIRLVRAEPNTPVNGVIGVVAVTEAEDDFADAEVLAAPTAGGTSTIGRFVPSSFGSQGGESVACGSGSMETASAWFEFTAAAAGTWFFEATSDENLDTAIYRGSSLGALDLIGCTLWSEGTSAGQSVHLDAGETVFLRIGASATATLSLRVRQAPVRMAAEKLTDVADDVESVDLVVVDGQPVVVYSDGPDDDLRIIERDADGMWVDSLVTDGTAFGGPDIDDFVSALVVGDELMVVFVTYGANLLMFGVRDAGGDWAFETIDTIDEFQYPDLAVVDGVASVSYYSTDEAELRFAERNGDGSWDVVVVDDDGPGTSTDVGYQSVLFDIDGEPSIAYLDYTAGAIRWASRSGATWSESLVYTHAPTTYVGFDGVIDADGNPLLISQFEYSSFAVLRLVEGVWTIEWPEHQPESTQVAYARYSPLQLELTPDGRPIFVWYSYETANYWYAVTEQLEDGTWRTDDAFSASQLLAEDLVDVEIDPYIIGAAMLPDGRFAFAGDLTDDIWYFEEALVAAVGDDVDTTAAVDFALDGSGTADRFGALAEIGWTLPAGCFAADGAALVTTGRCAGPADGQATLTVTDTDGYTRSASFDLTTGRAVCDDTPDPFTDVSPTSYARLDITCIYNLGVTTGSSATTYTPSAFVTREMMASFIMRLYRSLTGLTPPTVATPFADVPSTSFAIDDIAQLYGLGITTGTGPTTYSPYGQVTREQMVTFLGRLYELVRGAAAPVVETPFEDTDDLTWSAEFVASMYGIGVTTGTTSTTFSPHDNVTREQVAALLARLFRAE